MPGGTLPQLGNVAMGQVLTATLTPAASVTNASSSTSTYTVNGIVVGDCIDLYPQAALTTTLTIGSVWVSASNTLSVQWVNSTSGSSTASPTAIVFAIQVTRPSNVYSGVASYPTAVT